MKPTLCYELPTLAEQIEQERGRLSIARRRLHHMIANDAEDWRIEQQEEQVSSIGKILEILVAAEVVART